MLRGDFSQPDNPKIIIIFLQLFYKAFIWFINHEQNHYFTTYKLFIKDVFVSSTQEVYLKCSAVPSLCGGIIEVIPFSVIVWIYFNKHD